MYLLGYDLSVAVGVGFIALAGVAAETGVVMLIYLDQAYEKARRGPRDSVSRGDRGGDPRRGRGAGPPQDDDGRGDHGRASSDHVGGAGTGSEVMKRIAAPMIGGMVSSTILTLVVIPVIYAIWKERVVRKR